MEEKNILKARALKISKESKKSVHEGKKRFIVIRVEKKHFAIRYEEIIFIGQNREIRILPKVSSPFIGIVNFKGTIFNVADIKLLLNQSDQSNKKNLIFLKKYFIALVYDAVDDLVFISENAIKSISNSDFNFIKTFYSHDEQDVYIINLKEFYETCISS